MLRQEDDDEAFSVCPPHDLLNNLPDLCMKPICGR
jgi:hypothetical protein